MLSIGIGPFALAVDHLVLLGALGVAVGVSGWLARRQGLRSPENMIFGLFLLALLVARLGFVALYAREYMNNPWQVIDLRDGGFLLAPGLLTLSVAALWQGWRQRALRIPLAAAMASGLAIWGGGGLFAHLQQANVAMPQVALLDAHGAGVALPGSDPRPLVVNLWASWCPPCRREVPVLLKAQAGRHDVRFVFINQGEAPQDVSNFIATAGLEHQQIAYDIDSQWGRQLRSVALPTTLFYSSDGRLLGSHLGELSEASLTDAMKVFPAP
ncbi:prolipoprotein diacylglyceryl transferase family protein [Pseudomonas putida]